MSPKQVFVGPPSGFGHAVAVAVGFGIGLAIGWVAEASADDDVPSPALQEAIRSSEIAAPMIPFIQTPCRRQEPSPSVPRRSSPDVEG